MNNITLIVNQCILIFFSYSKTLMLHMGLGQKQFIYKLSFPENEVGKTVNE